MKCGRCNATINEPFSLLTYTVVARMNPHNMNLCEKCTFSFLEWMTKGNYIQQKINDEEMK